MLLRSITPLILYLSALAPLAKASNCYFQQPGLVTPSPSDCEAAINLIPPGLVFDPNSPGSQERLNLSIPDTHRRSYELPSAFIANSCSIIIKFDDTGLPASSLYFQFWPAVRALAKQVMNECVVGQTQHRVWGGYGTGTYTDPGEVDRGYVVNVKGWSFNIYTPHGELVV